MDGRFAGVELFPEHLRLIPLGLVKESERGAMDVQKAGKARLLSAAPELRNGWMT